MKSSVGKILILWGILVSTSAMAKDEWREVMDLSGRWKFTIGDNREWSKTHVDDSGWERIRVPDSWENQGFHGFDGYAWYRLTFDGSKLDKNETNLSLFLGYIDDIDETYLNGVKIGRTGSFPPRFQTAYNAKRQYPIPANLINYSGKNVIAVRVYDVTQYGGIVSGDVGIYANQDDKELVVNLRGMWNFKLLPRWKEGTKPTIDLLDSKEADWVQIMAPLAWEHQGYHKYDGGAVYHRSFEIPKAYMNESLMLIIGAIDDKDWVFFNNQLIGHTDGHNKLRAYTITPDMYDANDLNVLTIYIEDSTGEGGIVKGPVGLIRHVDFTRFIRWR